MAHRTRRRAVKREQRDASLARHLKLCGDLRLIHECTAREMRMGDVYALATALQFAIAPGCKLSFGFADEHRDSENTVRVVVSTVEVK